MAFTLLVVFAYYNIGRRKIFMVSTIGCALALTCLAICTVCFHATGSTDASRGTMIFTYFLAWNPFLLLHQFKYFIPVKLILTKLDLRLINITAGISQFVNQFASKKKIAIMKCWFWVFHEFFLRRSNSSLSISSMLKQRVGL